MTQFRNDSIFWIEVDKIKPNPYQPRREFDEIKLRNLAESIRQYGVLQPLVATRQEELHEDGGLSVIYELIAGERRLRAAKLAGLSQVPVIIRSAEDQDREKLELAIIENLQREDLNPIERAQAFQRLVNEFRFRHGEIARKIGKSREYVSNSIRILVLPQGVQDAVTSGKITEGHARSLLMLSDKPEEQQTLFREIVLKHLTVRDAEALARRAAVERVRKKSLINPAMMELEQKLTDSLGTRVRIEPREEGGKILIDYFSQEELQGIMDRLVAERKSFFERLMPRSEDGGEVPEGAGETEEKGEASPEAVANAASTAENTQSNVAPPPQEADVQKEELPDNELYSVKNFSI